MEYFQKYVHTYILSQYMEFSRWGLWKFELSHAVQSIKVLLEVHSHSHSTAQHSKHTQHTFNLLVTYHFVTCCLYILGGWNTVWLGWLGLASLHT